MDLCPPFVLALEEMMVLSDELMRAIILGNRADAIFRIHVEVLSSLWRLIRIAEGNHDHG
jgi:hypothetical protein